MHQIDEIATELYGGVEKFYGLLLEENANRKKIPQKFMNEAIIWENNVLGLNCIMIGFGKSRRFTHFDRSLIKITKLSQINVLNVEFFLLRFGSGYSYWMRGETYVNKIEAFEIICKSFYVNYFDDDAKRRFFFSFEFRNSVIFFI